MVPGIADLIEAHATAGQLDEAARLLTWLTKQADACARRSAQLAAARCGVLLNTPHAEDRLRHELDRDDGQTTVESGRSWLVLGSAQRRRGNRRTASESLYRAHRLLSTAGAVL